MFLGYAEHITGSKTVPNPGFSDLENVTSNRGFKDRRNPHQKPWFSCDIKNNYRQIYSSSDAMEKPFVVRRLPSELLVHWSAALQASPNPSQRTQIYHYIGNGTIKGKGKVNHTPQESIAECSSPSPRPWDGRWRTLMSVTCGQCAARPTVTFPAAGHHRPLAGIKLYCLVTEAHVC